MADLLGIHAVWTRPTRVGSSKIAEMLQFEVITMALSCLWWRRLQGPIKLYCDPAFLTQLQTAGLTELWSEIDIAALDQGLTNDVNHDRFWAWAKMYVNSLQTEPFVSLDIDLFINQPYDFTSHDIVCSHIELADAHETDLVFYPNYHEWPEFKSRFSAWPWLKFNERALNVAVLAINQPAVYQEFVQIGASFVADNQFDPISIQTSPKIHPSSLMTFVEQRLLSAVAESKGLTVKYMLDQQFQAGIGWLGEVEDLQNPGITHLWGWKDTYRKPGREIERQQLTQNLENHFAINFPAEYSKLMPKIREYYAQ